jgi:tetratricopeptide (TPR) repeat protein
MSSTKKSNIVWFSVSLVLLSLFVAVVWVFVGLFPTVTVEQNANTSPVISKVNVQSIEVLARQLVEKFVAINLPNKEKDNVFQAIHNTLQHLQNNHHDQAVDALKKLELDTSINALIEYVKQEKEAREAAKIWVDIGNLQQLKSFQLALIAYQKASELDEKNSNAWNRLGHYYRHQKQFIQAEKAYSKVLELSTEGSMIQAVALANFGLLYQAQAKHHKAETSYLKALEINKVQHNIAGLASNNENLAIIYKKNNNFSLSEAHYLAAISYYNILNRHNSIASTQQALASLYHKYHKVEKAKNYYLQALDGYKVKNNQKKIASTYSNLGILYQQQKQIEQAQVFFEKALMLNQKIQQQKGIADQYGNLGVLNRLQKKFIVSEVSHLKSLKIYQRLQQLEGVSQQQTNLGFLYQAWGKTEKACQHWDEGKNTLLQLNNKDRIERIEAVMTKHCKN